MSNENLWKKNKKKFTKAETLFIYSPFRRKCTLAGLTHGGMTDAEELRILSEFFGVAERTVRRWIKNEVVAHPSAERLLFNVYMGFPQHGRWCGWQLTDDYLVSPSSETISPDMIGKLWLWRNEKRALQARYNTLSLENERLRRIGAHDTHQKIIDAANLLADIVTINEPLKQFA